MVVHSFRSHLSLIDCTATTFGFHPILGCDVISKEAVVIGLIAKERKATSVAHGNCQASVDKRFPVVCIEDDVADCSLALDVGDTPIVANPITVLSLIFMERNT